MVCSAGEAVGGDRQTGALNLHEALAAVLASPVVVITNAVRCGEDAARRRERGQNRTDCAETGGQIHLQAVGRQGHTFNGEGV